MPLLTEIIGSDPKLGTGFVNNRVFLRQHEISERARSRVMSLFDHILECINDINWIPKLRLLPHVSNFEDKGTSSHCEVEFRVRLRFPCTGICAQRNGTVIASQSGCISAVRAGTVKL